MEKAIDLTWVQLPEYATGTKKNTIVPGSGFRNALILQRQRRRTPERWQNQMQYRETGYRYEGYKTDQPDRVSQGRTDRYRLSGAINGREGSTEYESRLGPFRFTLTSSYGCA